MILGLLVAAVLMLIVLSGCADEVGKEPDVFALGLNPERDYLILVNAEHEYEFDGSYDRDLLRDIIYVSDTEGVATPVEKGTYLAFSQLKQRLHEKGIQIELYSAYRTKADQEWVYRTYGKKKGWSETNRVMEPGFSEHHTGLMVNFQVYWPDENGDYVWTTETAERQKEIPELVTIRDNLADFGFIERYPVGKEDITGVPCEPYEIRFVGSSDVAHEIMDNNLCLEEYLEKNK